MKRKILVFAIGCVCAFSALLFQSCVREEDYEQSIIGDWELEKYTYEYGETHKYGWATYHYEGTTQRVVEEDHIEEVSGPHKIVLDDFEKACMVSFKSDGQYIYSSGTDISNGNSQKWTVIGSAMKLEGGLGWNCGGCRYKDNSYLTGEELYDRYVDTTIVGYHSDYTRFELNIYHSITIESLTRNKLTIKVEDINQYHPEWNLVKTFKFKKA